MSSNGAMEGIEDWARKKARIMMRTAMTTRVASPLEDVVTAEAGADEVIAFEARDGLVSLGEPRDDEAGEGGEGFVDMEADSSGFGEEDIGGP